jgi:GNAT superfamily N-acetyltransferase
VPDPRLAAPTDRSVVARVAAAGFYDDPVLSWVFPEPSTRRSRLENVFGGLVDDTIPGRGEVWVLDGASVAFWRDPSFEHGRTAADRVQDPAPTPDPPPEPEPFTDEELERLVALGTAMGESHPHEEHWYLNVVSTLPERQGQGLGAAILQPVLRRCDEEGHRAYLESTNPKNRSLYRRHGFVEAGEIPVAGGPSLMQMWRDPR